MGSSILHSRALVQRVACAAATPPPTGRCKRTTLKDESFQYQVRYFTQRQRTGTPQKGLFKSRLLHMGSPVLYSWALVQRVACAAATTPPTGRCKKTTLKDESLQYQVLCSTQRRQTAPPKNCYLKVECFIWAARYFIQGHWSNG